MFSRGSRRGQRSGEHVRVDYASAPRAVRTRQGSLRPASHIAGADPGRDPPVYDGYDANDVAPLQHVPHVVRLMAATTRSTSALWGDRVAGRAGDGGARGVGRGAGQVAGRIHSVQEKDLEVPDLAATLLETRVETASR
jgi:hypothetical protein